MSRIVRDVLIAGLSLLLASAPAWAQATAELSGRVANRATFCAIGRRKHAPEHEEELFALKRIGREDHRYSNVVGSMSSRSSHRRKRMRAIPSARAAEATLP